MTVTFVILIILIFVCKQPAKGKMCAAAEEVFDTENFVPFDDSMSESAKGLLLSSLKESNATCNMIWLLDTENDNREEDGLHKFSVATLSSELTDIVILPEKLMLSPVEISQIEEGTRGQRLNPSWSILRDGRLTASNFGAVLTAIRRNSYPPSLFSRLKGIFLC